MEGCNHSTKGKTITDSQWYKHLVCNCRSDKMTDRKRITLAVKTTQTDVLRWKETYTSNELQRQTCRISCIFEHGGITKQRVQATKNGLFPYNRAGEIV